MTETVLNSLTSAQSTPHHIIPLLGYDNDIVRCYENNRESVVFTKTRVILTTVQRRSQTVTAIPFKNLLSVSLILNAEGKHTGLSLTGMSGERWTLKFAEISNRETLFAMVYDRIAL